MLLTVFHAEISASVWNIRGSTGVYSWKQPVNDEKDVNRLRGYQNLRLSFYNSETPVISLKTFMKVSSDMRNRTDRDPLTRVYNVTLGLHSRSGMGDVYIGRQYVMDGVAFGAMDGIRYKNRVKGIGKISFFAGAAAPIFQSLRIGRWNQGSFLGGSVFITRLPRSEVKISYSRKSQQHTFRELNGTVHELPRLGEQLIGIDTRFFFHPVLTQYIYAVWDIPAFAGKNHDDFQNRLNRFEWATTLFRDAHYYLTFEYIYRNPQVPYYSFFINFRELFEAHTEYGMRLDYWMNSALRLDAYVALVDYYDDTTARFRGGVRWRNLYAGYVRRNGPAGERQGMVVSASGRLSNKLTVRTGIDYTQVKIVEDAPDENVLSSLFIHASYSLTKKVSIDCEVQHLRQNIRNRNAFDVIPFKGYDGEFRLLGRIQYWFSTHRMRR